MKEIAIEDNEYNTEDLSNQNKDQEKKDDKVQSPAKAKESSNNKEATTTTTDDDEKAEKLFENAHIITLIS